MTKTITIIKGCFFLKPGIRLFPDDNGGIVLQPDPLRVIRVNSAAYDILKKCETGLSADIPSSVTDFLDLSCQAEILEWEPSDEIFEPLVSIIIPVYNRAHEIGPCLESLLSLDYPLSDMEIIVVDDASQDNTADMVRNYPVRLITQKQNMGQSAARNIGVRAACGEIIAFIDSDCTADPNWLRDLLPYFHDSRNALVGGYVDSFFRETWLDRYEEVHSPLNMGQKKIIGAGKYSAFYVPTCNLLIRKSAYNQVGGLDETTRIGEDVDLCWKLRRNGYRLIYVPKGTVKHKHRNIFFQSFKRRFDYGTSEAFLYDRYGETAKRFPWQTGGLIFFFLCCAAFLAWPQFFIFSALCVLIGESVNKKILARKNFGVSLDFRNILLATLRSHFLLAYYLTYYIIRYYFLPIIIAMIFFQKIAFLLMFIVLFPTTAEFFIKKPRLIFPVFVFCFWAEQAFYQTGVFWGCVKKRNFRLYRISFVHAGFLKK